MADDNFKKGDKVICIAFPKEIYTIQEILTGKKEKILIGRPGSFSVSLHPDWLRKA